jgi:prepilin-type N-terminal cleavage/methylation domain-containing protein
MKGRPQSVRCSGDNSRRGQHVRRFSPAGFSLLELLIVAAILLALTSLYWGSSSRSAQKRQQQVCRNNLQKIFVALEIYADEQAGKFPQVTNASTSAEALNGLVPRYTADTSVFICPGSKNPPTAGSTSLLKQKISFAYYMGRCNADASEALMSDQQVDTLAKAPGQLTFSPDGTPPGNNHHQYGGNFLFCDGRTEPSPPRVPFSLGLTQGVVLLNP